MKSLSRIYSIPISLGDCSLNSLSRIQSIPIGLGGCSLNSLSRIQSIPIGLGDCSLNFRSRIQSIPIGIHPANIWTFFYIIFWLQFALLSFIGCCRPLLDIFD